MQTRGVRLKRRGCVWLDATQITPCELTAFRARIMDTSNSKSRSLNSSIGLLNSNLLTEISSKFIPKPDGYIKFCAFCSAKISFIFAVISLFSHSITTDLFSRALAIYSTHKSSLSSRIKPTGSAFSRVKFKNGVLIFSKISSFLLIDYS